MAELSLSGEPEPRPVPAIHQTSPRPRGNWNRPRTHYEALFIAEQPTIRSAIVRVARRHRLSLDEVDELASDVALKLIEDDYAVLRKFEGRSSLHTYLNVVVNRILLDRRIAAWGKWRPSAQARRLGPGAVLFERLMLENVLSFDAACDAVERTHGTVDRTALAGLVPRLRTRRRQWPLDVNDLECLPTSATDPRAALLDEGRLALAERAAAALSDEIEALPPDDRELIRRRFFDGTSVVTLARDTRREPKLLYRYMARLFAQLRRRLEARGVTDLQVREWLASPR